MLQGAWAAVLVATGTFRVLFTRVVYTEWIFFALLAVGLMRLRRREGRAAGARMWGFPVTALVFIVSSIAVAANAAAANPRDGAIGLALVAAGIPIYHFRQRAGRAGPRLS